MFNDFKLSDKKLSDITTFRTNKLSEKMLSESLIVRKFSILMYKHLIDLLMMPTLRHQNGLRITRVQMINKELQTDII